MERLRAKDNQLLESDKKISIILGAVDLSTMKNGSARFTYYLQQIKELLNKAREQKNPAIWLFNHNARTPFFMLEGLAKIYAEIHNTKKFSKLKEHFKLIEDGLGQIDYYHSLSIVFAADKKIPVSCRQYIKKKSDQRATQLNEVLEDKGWLTDDNKRINKITLKLSEADWLSSTEDVEAISDFYKESIAAITEFVTETDYHFYNIEKDVHELRRKLRWLSIYPQALQGAIQYSEDTKAAANLKKYMTKEIVSSPYNILPVAGSNKSFVLIHKSCFLALSWMIAQLGNLKDEGLLVTGLCEAIKQDTVCTGEETLAKAYAVLGRKQRRIEAILYDAEAITKTFFKENNLQHLIIGTTTASG